jgi:hypothetical protein
MLKAVHAKFSAAIAMDLSPPRAPLARPIEKPDDNHRKPKLESFTSAFYLHSRKTPFGKTHRRRRPNGG